MSAGIGSLDMPVLLGVDGNGRYFYWAQWTVDPFVVVSQGQRFYFPTDGEDADARRLEARRLAREEGQRWLAGNRPPGPRVFAVDFPRRGSQ